MEEAEEKLRAQLAAERRRRVQTDLQKLLVQRGIDHEIAELRSIKAVGEVRFTEDGQPRVGELQGDEAIAGLAEKLGPTSYDPVGAGKAMGEAQRGLTREQEPGGLAFR